MLKIANFRASSLTVFTSVISKYSNQEPRAYSDQMKGYPCKCSLTKDFRIILRSFMGYSFCYAQILTFSLG